MCQADSALRLGMSLSLCAVDGVLYVQIIDAVKASYGVDNIPYATVQLAQTVMRSELGKMTLDRTFQERDSLNLSIVKSLNEATEPWGLRCLRHEIRSVSGGLLLIELCML